jgi:hypothetical protein
MFHVVWILNYVYERNDGKKQNVRPHNLSAAEFLR